MQSGRVHLFPSMVEANTAMYLKKLSDMLQAIFDSLSQEASSEGELCVSCLLAVDVAMLINRLCLSLTGSLTASLTASLPNKASRHMIQAACLEPWTSTFASRLT